jgi:transketolase
MTHDVIDFARRLRGHALRIVGAANASHIGSCLSAADVLAVLYADVLRVDSARPHWPDRDRFILSKGHAAAILYAALAERGFLSMEQLATYCADGSTLTGHVSHMVPGVEVSTGSLGHGLPIGCGMALGAKRRQEIWRTFVLLSDGELDEGSNWEAALFAGHHELDQLIAIVDYNKIQSFGNVKDVLELEPLAEKWRTFRWEVREVDGHDVAALHEALTHVPFQPGRPSVVIAHTVKGKGVSFMENDLLWHYRSPDQKQLAAALTELGCGE